MNVKVRAVIARDGKILVASERRQAEEHLTLPGGRVDRKEGLVDALVREVEEETGLRVKVGPLLYLAEVVSGSTAQELNVFFRAGIDGGDGDSALLLGRDDPECARVMPPILPTIFDDMDAGWRDTPRWLGNIHERVAAPQ
jgi:ADP-ribose pyrophosphatase YjhB (NUDIX family)